MYMFIMASITTEMRESFILANYGVFQAHKVMASQTVV
jgi:hypothetical protein